MGHHCCSKQKVKRGLWSPEEDDKLLNHVTHHGHSSWSSVPKLAGLQRCGKSCRLRWINYLRPDLRRGSFTKDEERTIIEVHRILGNRWSQIATHLPGRTDNEIKNFWNSCIKKKLIAQGLDPNTHNLLSSHHKKSKNTTNNKLSKNTTTTSNSLPFSVDNRSKTRDIVSKVVDQSSFVPDHEIELPNISFELNETTSVKICDNNNNNSSNVIVDNGITSSLWNNSETFQETVYYSETSDKIGTTTQNEFICDDQGFETCFNNSNNSGFDSYFEDYCSNNVVPDELLYGDIRSVMEQVEWANNC